MIYLEKKTKDIYLAIWKIEETRNELLSLLDNRAWLTDILMIKNEGCILEKLAIRVLLKMMLGKEEQISYSSFGKPFLDDCRSDISISHTDGFVAIILSYNCKVGIDIEKKADKVKRIQSRFISDEEYIDIDCELDHLLLHWSAKETLFKVLNQEGVDFLNHLRIKPFTPVQEGIMNACEYKTKARQGFEIHYRVLPAFVLTYLSANDLA